MIDPELVAQEDQMEAVLGVGIYRTQLEEGEEEHADSGEAGDVLERFLGEGEVVRWRLAALLDMANLELA